MKRFQGARRAGRSRRDGFAGQFLQDIAAAASVAAGHQASRPGRGRQPASGARWPVTSRHNRPATTTTIPRRHTLTVPRLLPRTIQLCIHCRQRPAGFWVSRRSGQTVRRPWCLSCCQGLDRDHHDIIPFDN